jgi:two-component system, NtrC family, response regulator HydG
MKCGGEVDRRPHDDQGLMVTASTSLHAVLDQARMVARSPIAVLIQGESGTGKELLARLIHANSQRSGGPWVRVNCAALSETLVESELFGHEKGAFTGAETARPGRFELAHTGTLLLDEIGEMPLKLQAKLLRVLEEEEFERVGGTNTLRVDVRVVATTNRLLEAEVAAGAFRQDLLYRLNAVTLQVPPLRDRPEDIPLLVQHFFHRYRQESSQALRGFSKRALEIAQTYSWPGNVRQLRNAVHRACLLAAGPDIEPYDLPALHESSSASDQETGQTLAFVEKQMILGTLQDVGGNKTVAASRLGITTRTLHNKLARYRQADAA